MNIHPRNSDAAKKYYATRTFTTAWPNYNLDNPSHGADAVERQIGHNMGGFVADFARKTTSPEHWGLVMQ